MGRGCGHCLPRDSFVRLLIKPQRRRNHGSLSSFNGRTSPATPSETPIRASGDKITVLVYSSPQITMLTLD